VAPSWTEAESDAALARVREACLGLPEASEDDLPVAGRAAFRMVHLANILAVTAGA